MVSRLVTLIQAPEPWDAMAMVNGCQWSGHGRCGEQARASGDGDGRWAPMGGRRPEAKIGGKNDK